MPNTEHPLVQTLSADQKEFYLWAGMCITVWSDIEHHLFNIFWRAIGSPEDHAAILYFRIGTVKARIDTVDEIVQTLFIGPERNSGGHKDKNLKAWDELIIEISNCLAVRNAIAHHPPMAVLHFVQQEPLIAADMSIWWEIGPSDSERLRGRSAKKKSFRIADMQKHVLDVRGFRERLREFFRAVLLPQLEGRVLPPAPRSQDLYPISGR